MATDLIRKKERLDNRENSFVFYPLSLVRSRTKKEEEELGKSFENCIASCASEIYKTCVSTLLVFSKVI